ncbi:unnamed protein product, partial [Medioppia subpectinata]
MFNKVLPDNINVYAVTSSLPDETRNFLTYDDKLKTYISSFFANNWLVNDETYDLENETFDEQYNSANNDNEKLSYVKEMERVLNGRQYVDKHINDYVNSIQHLLTVERYLCFTQITKLLIITIWNFNKPI